VRVRAAWDLRDSLDPNSPAGRDLLQSLAVSADQPTGAMELASYYASRGDLQTAAGYAQKGVTWDPNSAALRDGYANILILLGRTAPAAEQLEWASRLAPRDATYLYKLGLAYDKLGRGDDAVNTIARAESIDPTNPELPYARATILYRLGRRPEAREAAQRALQINPNYTPAAEFLQTVRP
jgi:tetratricopeptide (TPR) repeat protein